MTQSQLLDLLSPLPPPAQLGEVLEGKYRLDRVVATGGMGVVVAAMHLNLDQRVAIKFVSPQLAGDDGVVRRFLQEARAAARLRSEHVVRVFDVDTLSSGTPYIVMEFLEGEDLSAMLARRGWLPPSEAVDCVLQACEAIAEAHLLGIVHRDLKPGNLFHCARADQLPFVKVLDFGVSKLLPGARVAWRERASTGPHVVMGTPVYASPEQLCSSSRVDVRADIWALGVILYELIAGRPPFRGDTFLELRAKVAKGSIQPLHELRPEVPPELGAVVARCLAKEPQNRYATVAEFAEALAGHAPRSASLSVKRVENILRTQLDATLPSATGSRAVPRVPPSVASTKRTAPTRHSPRVMLGSVAGGVVGGALIAALVASVPRLESRSTLRSAEGAAAPAAVPAAIAPPLPSASLEPLPAPSAAPEDTPSAATAATTASALPTARSSPPPAPSPPRARAARGTEGFGGLL